VTRHFLRDDDLAPAEQAAVLDLADQMKKDRHGSAASGGDDRASLAACGGGPEPPRGEHS
jgi:ornithine carbamoyltransferase